MCVVTNDFTSPRATIRVVKRDKDNSDPATNTLAGAQFQLRENKVPIAGSPGAEDPVVTGSTRTTGADGVAEWTSVKAGSYWIVETIAPTGYTLASPAYQAVTVTRDDGGRTLTTATDYLNSRSRSTLSAAKTDKDTGLPMSGVTFTLHNSNAAGDKLTSTGKSCVTAANGICSVTGLDFGWYGWVETPVAGYQTPDPNFFPAPQLTASNAGTVIAATQVTNLQKRTQLEVLKLDADTEQPVKTSTATFKLYLDAHGAGAGTVGPEDTLVATETTDADGRAVFTNLLFGKYLLVEVSAPVGYQLDPTPVPVTVNAGNAGTTIEMTFADRRKLTSLTLHKTDATTGADLAGAVFELRSGSSTGPLATGVGNPCTTGADGNCTVSGLTFGTYVWVETAAPTGYTYDPASPWTSAPIEVTWQSAGTALPVTDASNAQIPTTITVVKRDGNDKTTTLPDAVFMLWRDGGDGVFTGGAAGGDDTKAVGEAQKTGPDGTTSFSGLTFGTYWAEEVTAPPGYDLAFPSVVKVVITAQSAATTPTLTYTFDNPRKTSRIEIVKTDKVTQAPLGGFTFALRTSPGGANLSTCTTAADGRCAFQGLDFGTYWVVETEVTDGYVLDTVARGPYVVGASNAGTEIARVEVANDQVRTSLTVVKTDAKTGAELDGAQFQLWRDSGDGDFEPGSDQKVGDPVGTTGGSFTWTGLTFGTYWVQETAAPTGYTLPADPVSAAVTITPENAGTPVTRSFADPRKLTSLTLTKTDATTGKALAGAVFELRVGGVTGAKAAGANNPCTTASDGTCTVTGVDFGTYVWVETAAPAGYVFDPANPWVSAPIVVTSQVAGTSLASVAVTNAQILTDVVVNKTDAVTGKPLDGATFQLWKDDGDGAFNDTLDSKVGDPKGTTVGTVAFSGLAFGTYFVTEVTAPTGYTVVAPSTSTPIVIDPPVAGKTQTRAFANDRKTTTLTVRKADAAFPDKVLAGATFALWTADATGNLVADTAKGCTTGTDGLCSVSGLGFGTYVWVETAAPPGYLLPTGSAANSAPIEVNAANAGTQIAAVTFLDVAEAPTVSSTTSSDAAETPVTQPVTTTESWNGGTLPQTGGNASMLIGLALATLLGGLVLLAMGARRRRH